MSVSIGFAYDPFESLDTADLPEARGGSYSEKIATYRDPLTLPHTRVSCLKEKWGVCYEWKTEFKYHYVDLYVMVWTGEDQDVRRAVRECLRSVAVAAALSLLLEAVGTSGTTAGTLTAAAFIHAITKCLEKKLDDVIDVKLDTRTYWGDWE